MINATRALEDEDDVQKVEPCSTFYYKHWISLATGTDMKEANTHEIRISENNCFEFFVSVVKIQNEYNKLLPYLCRINVLSV